MSEEEEEVEDVDDNYDGEPQQLSPENDEKELLFLIEFLVDTLCVNPNNMNIENMDPCMLQGQNCIVMTFLHFPPMHINENDLDPNKQTGEDVTKFNSGKSLMFALSESQFENPPPIYLEVVAHKQMPHGSMPSKLPIGMTKICLSELFKQVFEKVDEKPDKLPLSKSIKDTYQLMGTKNKVAGEITIYIRLSCLGQNVITEFQRGSDACDPFLFKNKESNKVYECKAKEVNLGVEAEDVCPPCPGWGKCVPRDKKRDCCDESITGGSGGIVAGQGWENDQEYDEFGTEVNGHALTIKIQKSQKKENRLPYTESEFCACNVNLTYPKSSERGRSFGKDSGGINGGAGNQVVFKVPKSENHCKKNNGPQVYNISGTENGGSKREALQVFTEGEPDPDNDVFVLRVGKKGEAFGKGKMELELRTPKIKIELPSSGPKKVDREIQTEKEVTPKKKGKGQK